MYTLFFVLYLCCSTIYAEEPDIPKVQIKIMEIDEWTCEYTVSRKLYFQEYFLIAVLNDGLSETSFCNDTATEKQIVRGFQRDNNYYVSEKVSKESEYRKTKIMCVLTPSSCWQHDRCGNSGNRSVYCEIDLDFHNIKDIKGHVEVYGLMLPTKPAPVTNTYDFEGVYEFFDGEPVTISFCHNTTSMLGMYLQMIYMKGKENITTLAYMANSMDIYVKLSANHDPRYIDFRVVKMHLPDKVIMEMTIRMFLKMKNVNPGIRFEVNGLKLASKANGDGRIARFVYEYFGGEELVVTTVKNGSKYDDMHCVTTNIPVVETPWTGSTLLINQKVENMSLACFENNASRYGDVQYTLELNPVENTFDGNYPSVSGLSNSNILLKFKDSSKTTLYYEYVEALSLKCSSLKEPVWKFNDTEIEVVRVENNNNKVDKGIVMKSAVFKMKAPAMRSAVSCLQSDLRTEVILINYSSHRYVERSVGAILTVFLTFTIIDNVV